MTSPLLNLKLIKTIWDKKPSFIIMSLIKSIEEVVLQVVYIYFSKYLMNFIVYHSPFYYILNLIGSFLAIEIIINIFNNWYDNIYCPKNTEIIKSSLRLEFLQKIAVIDIECFDKSEFYDKYVKALQEADTRSFSVLNSFCRFITSVISIFALIAVIFTLDSIMIIFAIIVVITSLIFTNKINKEQFSYDNQKATYNRKRDYIMRLFYLNNYAKEIKIEQNSEFFINKFKKNTDSVINIVKSYGKKVVMLKSVSQFFTCLFPALMRIYLAWRIFNKKLLFGDFSALMNASFNLTSNLRNLIGIIPEIKQHGLYIENLKIVLEYKPKITSKSDAIIIDKTQPHDIEFKNVSFTYPGSNAEILKNITLRIKKGEKIALVGQNGAGKSTLIKLLLRLYDTSSGEILIDNISIKDYELSSLRENFCVVFQDYQQYAFTIAENILFKEIELKDESLVVNALNQSGLYQRVSQLEKGIMTGITKEFDPNGVIFSGGQAQKLALARAFAKNGSIHIFDEPSSALDPIAENELFENMIKVAKDKTLIFISHRLSSAILADRIILLDNGEVVEEGTHQELMERDGKYANMYRVQ